MKVCIGEKMTTEIKDLNLRVRYGTDETIVSLNINALEGESDYVKVTFLGFVREKFSSNDKFFTIEPKEAEALLEQKRHDNHVYNFVKEHELNDNYIGMHRTLEKVLKSRAYTLDENKAMLLIKTFEKYAKIWNEPVMNIPKFLEKKFVIGTNNVKFFEENKESGLSLQIMANVAQFYKQEYCRKNKIEISEFKENFTFNNEVRAKAFDDNQNKYIHVKSTNNKDWNVFCHLMTVCEVAVSTDEIVEYETRKQKINEMILNEELQQKQEVRKRVRP